MSRMPGTGALVVPRSWSSGRPLGPARLIVIHYTAGSEAAGAAENGASYDQRRTDGTSAHFHIDRDSIIQCVDTANRSHTALYHGNAWGIHLELAGTAQTRAQWLDGPSLATIKNAARVCEWAMRAHNIPLVRLVGTQVRSTAARGICGHVDCTNGWPEDGGTHTDPGPQFPWDVLFQEIRNIQQGVDPVAVADEVWGFNVGSQGMEIPPKAVTEWLKSFEQGARDAKAAKDIVTPFGGSLSSILNAVQGLATQVATLQVKVDALALSAGDPNAIATAVADELHARTAE